MRRRRLVQPTRLRQVDAAGEALSVIVARPARAIATSLGTLLAVAWFVAVPGLVSTANAQVAMAFTQRLATQIRVTPASASPVPAAYPYPADVQERLDALDGVRAAGVFWQVRLAGPVIVSAGPLRPGPPGASPPGRKGPAVIAVSPGFLSAAGVKVTQGRSFTAWALRNSAQDCLIGSAAARSLHISGLRNQPTITINNESCVVIGIFARALRQPALLRSVLIPAATAVLLWGPPDQRAGATPTILIQTRPGAAPVVASQVPYAISPARPHRYVVSVRTSPQLLRNQVNRTLTRIFAIIGWVSLGVGALVIANVTWLSVQERTAEYALRRALGARRRHIAMHVIWESAITGLIGGLAGASLGLAVVVLLAHARHWTPVVAPLTVLPAPLAGAAAGVLAGLVPAIRAARIQPGRALRRAAA